MAAGRLFLLAVVLVAAACGDDGADAVQVAITTSTTAPATTATTATTTTTVPAGPALRIADQTQPPEDGEVTVELTGFAPGASIGLGLCHAAATETPDPLPHCQLAGTTEAGPDGEATTTASVQRWFRVSSGSYDCAVDECILAASEYDPANFLADVPDRDQAWVPLEFADEAPPLLEIATLPPPPFDEAALVSVEQTGLRGDDHLLEVCRVDTPEVCSPTISNWSVYRAFRMTYFRDQGFVDCGAVPCELVLTSQAGQRATLPLSFTGPTPPPVEPSGSVPNPYVEGTELTFRVDGAAHFTGVSLRVNFPDGTWAEPIWWPSRGDFRVPFVDDDTIEFSWASSGQFPECQDPGCEIELRVWQGPLLTWPFVVVPAG